MIDLSHLTEEEQVTIMRVLRRDADLRKAEEKRARHLQESVENEIRRKNMTGEWFYNAKAKRHKDTLHGSELIQASMRKKKPMTIYERLQTKEPKEKSKNLANNIYVPPELSVFLEDPKVEEPETSTTSQKNNTAPEQQRTPTQNTLSPGKQRENPFNKSYLEDIPNAGERPLLSAGTESTSPTPVAEKLSHPKDNVSRLHSPSIEFLEIKKPSSAVDDNCSERQKVPSQRTNSSKLQESVTKSDQLHTASGRKNWNGFNGNSTTPKSILKRSPSSSSNDSEILHISVQDSKSKIPVSPQTIPEGQTKTNTAVKNEDFFTPNSLERSKQVRFSPNVDEKKISQSLEPHNANGASKDSFLDTDYLEETDKENTDRMSNAEEDENPHKANVFSDLHRLSSPLQTNPLYLNQGDDNIMSNLDFQSIPATKSNTINDTNSHLSSNGSGLLTNQVPEMGTGEILMEKEANRRLNPAPNPSFHNVDERKLHTDFESPQVSNQQPTKISQGKHVNFAVPLFKTAATEQRHEAHSSQSQMLDKYTAEHMKAADESISKVLDWFTRSEAVSSVNTEAMKTPPDPIVEYKPKAVITVNSKPNAEFSHSEADIFTKKPQKLPNMNHEIQAQGEQEIQLQEVQTPIKENIFDKSLIPEPLLLEEKNKTRTKNDSEITYPLSENIFQSLNDEQQHIKLEQDEESKQEPSVLKYFPEKGRAGANEHANREPESAQAISEDTDFFLATDKNSAQETKSGPESTGWNVEELKTLPTISTKSTTEQALPTFQKHSPNPTTSGQENAFANMVFGKSARRESAIDIESSNYKLENEGTNLVTTESLYPVFLKNVVVQDLDNTKIEKEPHNDEISQLKRDGQCHVTTTREKPFLEKVMQRTKENVHAPVYDQSATTKNIAFRKMDSKSLFPKRNEQEINALQGKRFIDVPDLGQTLSNEEKKTEVDFHLENNTDAFPVNAKLEQTLSDKENKTEADLQLKENGANVIPVKDQPFTIVSIKKRICNISDNPSINQAEFKNLRNFWAKETKIDVGDDAQSVVANTPDGKRRMILKMPTSTEPEMLLEATSLVTKKPVFIQRAQTPSNSHTPDELSENESKKVQLYSGPSVQERMQQIRQHRETQTEKKKLNTKYFPKVLPTEPEEIINLKKARKSNENKLQSSDFQNHSSEVELSDHEPVNRRIVNSQEDINLRNSTSRPSTSDKIRNNDVENIPEKRSHSRIPSVLKPAGISYQDKNSSIGQSSSSEVSNNEENLTLFAGLSLVVEENDILQKKLSKYEPLDNAIQSSLKLDDLSFDEENLSPVKTDKHSKYDEDLGVALDKDQRGFDFEDQFKSDLNLPSGITKKSNFKEIYASPIKQSGERFKSDIPYNPYQDVSPKNVLSNYSGGNDHLRAESRRRSLTGEEEEMSALALKRNSRLNETYKSLQDINATSSRSNTLDSANKEMILSADNVYTIPISPENTSLQSKRMKRLSKSVPAFPENDDADSMSESSFQMDRHGTVASSLTNISSSSGMASRSSVSGSTMSIYSGDFGNIDVRGKMQFSLDYVDKLKEFHIFVVRCSDLAAAEEKKNRSDPYVKSYLLPDKIKMGKRKTSVKKKSLHPVYNEILRYKIEKATLLTQTLNLSVWHNDTFGRNSFLGEVEIELKKWDWSNKKMDWHNLKPRTHRINRLEDKGSLKVAFRYIPQGHGGKKTGEVHIWVKEASNLPLIRPNRLDPFVKCFILPDTSRKSRQSTRVVKKNRNPVFNHTMVYDGFRPEDLKDACVELSVWDRDKLMNHFLGGLRIGLGTGKSYGLAVDWMDSTEEEVSVWDKMITHPTIWIENVLPLRMLMLSKMSAN
ncbi:uncharacterized protein sytl2a isoform X1 [Scyliorhinus torazame]|uniref:uncharacterized protein sytl2a isoform X1 n=1 Tax=Scyliorhinus torazame TaxID=75743 RepID=UPI003B5C8A29